MNRSMAKNKSIPPSVQKNTLVVDSPILAASGSRSKNADARRTPAANAARKCDTLRANRTRIRRKNPPMRAPMLARNVKSRMYAKVGIFLLYGILGLPAMQPDSIAIFYEDGRLSNI